MLGLPCAMLPTHTFPVDGPKYRSLGVHALQCFPSPLCGRSNWDHDNDMLSPEIAEACALLWRQSCVVSSPSLAFGRFAMLIFCFHSLCLRRCGAAVTNALPCTYHESGHAEGC